MSLLPAVGDWVVVQGHPGGPRRVAMVDPGTACPIAISLPPAGYRRHVVVMSRAILARYESDAYWAVGLDYCWVQRVSSWRPATQEELSKHQLAGLEGL